MDEKDMRVREYEREFKENPQLINFNIDFLKVVTEDADERQEANEKKQEEKFLIEEEKEKKENKLKMELVKLIWKTVLLLLLLSLNFVLV